MRLDRAVVASIVATAVGFWLFPMLFPSFTLFAWGGAILTNFIVAGIAWIFVNVTYWGAGSRRGRR